MSSKVNIKNRKASFEYQFIDKYVAGIMLLGTEIKSIRNNQANISDAHCVFIEDELFVRNLHIAEYSNGGHNNHEPKRERKLLLNRQELGKMIGKVKEKGMSVIPIRLFINDKGKAKLEIALAKGKKIYDKRESIKEKDQKRDIAREQSTRK
ncbi:MAG TPA: SsrA-binding protein SmpB [Flavobacteriales bacterium]|jgi:SsrA-binding protein|nr:SsrA-binding protein SmpB [Flavobacteriales bacterium]HIK62823.1 SsrA-binding protein SmpB [Flavobacteriales bacterium]|tara:strand:- start:36 stop:491 length:456 start_codon:yes stop_codon:yes gene_type:complete